MFNGIWLVAAEPLTVQGREVKAGELFHVSRVHSGALLVTRKATVAHPQPPPKSRTPEPEAPAPPPRRRGRPRKTAVADTPAPPVMPQPEPVADPPLSDPPSVDSPSVATNEDDAIDVPRRHYHRRDLEAEE